MLLARGRFWRASLPRAASLIVLELRKAALPEDLQELRDLRVEVPLAKWNLLAKNVYADRKLLGGLLLDYAKNKDRVSTAVANDRLLAELRRVLLDATSVALEEGILIIVPAGGGAEGD
ncbi:MAG: hypothetical protein OEM49_02240 [Myxococcales bacterium]|nr:hypothetical protein [Myxococcales bacterium]MDH5306775.1 hypothetical protein [Myxococcales bacterium]MDH5566966.1 hypothetical protein [Myxococcales bacterium]